MTVTVQDLPAILADHAKWLVGDGGTRANLSGANLSRANLLDADLSGADLSGADIIDAGHRSDGYRFVGSKSEAGTIMVKAGCRFLSLPDARKHWSDTRGGTQLGNESLALCDHIERMAGILGWTVAEKDAA